MLSCNEPAAPLTGGGEERMTEISIAPDGRLYVFGASVGVLEALGAAGLGDESLERRLACLRDLACRTAAAGEQAAASEGEAGGALRNRSTEE